MVIKSGGREPRPGEQVRIYRNRTRGGYSLQVREPGRGWRVAAYLDDGAWSLVKAQVHTSEAGRTRARRTGVRNVHAWIQGAWGGPRLARPPWRRLTYSPWISPGWRLEGLDWRQGHEVERLALVVILPGSGEVRARK